MAQNCSFPPLLTPVLIFLQCKTFVPFIQQSSQTQMLPSCCCRYMSHIASSLAFHRYLTLQLSYSTSSNLSFFNPHWGHSLKFSL